MTRPTSDGVVPWPTDIAQSYRNAGFWEDRSVYSFAAEAASRHPEAIAVVDGDMRLTYRELVHRADSCAFRLRELGFARDDRMLVQLPNGWEFIALTLACLRIGVIPVMALPAHRLHELEHLARLSESIAVVVPDEHRDFDHQAMAQLIAQRVDSVTTVIVLGRANPGSLSLQDLLEPLSQPDLSALLDRDVPAGDDVAVFLLSGGTTGLPKLITRTHNDYAYNIMATSAVAGLGPESVYLVALPASHNFPLACPGFLGTLCAGGRVVTAGSPDPSRCLDLIRREGVTITAAVPAVAQRWIEHLDRTGEPPPPSLEVLQVGGSRLADELAARVAPVLGAKLQQVFGMAEGLICMTRLDDSEDIIIGTQGRPVSEADEVAVVDDEGRFLPSGSVGILLTRGPYTPRGYFRAAEQNTTSFTPDGWYISGDIVELRADGNLTVRGRDKDMINRGGEKVSGEEVENFVYQFDDVALAAAIAMPDPTLGERVCVYVELKPDGHLDLGAVRARMHLAGVAAYKLPERLVVVTQLPLTKVGKIDKKALREDIALRLAAE